MVGGPGDDQVDAGDISLLLKEREDELKLLEARLEQPGLDPQRRELDTRRALFLKNGIIPSLQQDCK